MEDYHDSPARPASPSLHLFSEYLIILKI